MAIVKDGIEYYVNDEEIIICGVEDRHISVLRIPSHINRFPVVSIERDVFQNMTELKRVELPHTLETIHNHAFADCPNLVSVYCDSPDFMISGEAFRNCRNLEIFQVKGVVNIQASAFSSCIGLKSFEGKIASVAKNSFANCFNLESLTFAEEMYRFHGEAFVGCHNLKNMFFLGSGVVFDGMQNFPMRDVSIKCSKNSNVAELAYQGYNVTVRTYL